MTTKATISRNLSLSFERAKEDKRIQPEHIIYWFSKFRIYIESENRSETYPHLNLYCNWILHTKISNSAAGSNLIIEVAKIISDQYDDTNMYSNHNDRICDTFNLATVRNEIIILLKELACDYDLFTNKFFWTNIVSILMHELINKNLSIKMDKLPAIETLSFKPDFVKLTPQGKNKISWEVIPSASSPIQKPVAGILYYTESDEDFESLGSEFITKPS